MPSTTRSKSKKNKKKTVPRNPPYIRMVFEAITSTRHAGKGVSRAKVASYIKANYENIAEGPQFNSCLRRALKDGIDRGVLENGETIQRYKITNLGRKERSEKNESKKYDIEEEEEKAKKEEKKRKAAEKKRKAAEKKRKQKEKEEREREAAKKKKKKTSKKSKRGPGRPKKSTTTTKKSSKRKTRR